MSLNWNVSKTPAYKAKIEEHGEDGDWSWETDEWNVLEGLIWATMAVDLPGMPKEEDVDEMLFRLRFCEQIDTYKLRLPDHITRDDLPEDAKPGDVIKIDGEALEVREYDYGLDAWREEHPEATHNGGEEDPGPLVWRYRSITREDLEPFVGMTTNVSRKTRHQFVQRHAKQVRERVERNLRRESEDS